jgi:hypothetical protein
MPSVNFNQSGQKSPGSASQGKADKKSTASRGKNWALPDAKVHQTGVTRPIKVRLEADRIVILPEVGDSRPPKVVPVAPELSPDDVSRVVATVQNEVQGWGLAVADGYWKPVLQAEVGPGAERHFLNMETALHGSGIDIVRR